MSDLPWVCMPFSIGNTVLGVVGLLCTMGLIGGPSDMGISAFLNRS